MCFLKCLSSDHENYSLHTVFCVYCLLAKWMKVCESGTDMNNLGVCKGSQCI